MDSIIFGIALTFSLSLVMYTVLLIITKDTAKQHEYMSLVRIGIVLSSLFWSMYHYMSH